MKARRIITILIPVILLAAALLFGSILLMRLVIASVLMLALSYLWTLFSIRKMSAESSAPPEHIQVGDSFKWQTVVKNTDRLPQPWVRLQNDTDLPGQRGITAVSIPAKGAYTWVSDITCLRRGRHHLGKVSITAADPFGIFTRQRVLGEAKEFIVYPSTIDLPHFKSSSFSDLGAGYRSLNRISTDASGVRDFSSGDSLRHIHWPSTARTGNIMVKLFDVDRSYNASKHGWILLDMHKESHFHSQEQASDEHAITIAASVINKYLQGGMRVGLLTSGNDANLIKPDRGEDHRWRLLKALALLQMNNGETLNEIVGRNSGIFRDNPLIVVVATSATHGLMDTVQQLKPWGDLVIVIHLDIESWSGQQSGLNRLQALQRLGAQVFPVRKTDELAAALDSKISHVHPAMVQEAVCKENRT